MSKSVGECLLYCCRNRGFVQKRFLAARIYKRQVDLSNFTSNFATFPHSRFLFRRKGLTDKMVRKYAVWRILSSSRNPRAGFFLTKFQKFMKCETQG